MKKSKYTPIISRKVNGGQQHVFRFPNQYGASVVRHRFSYGGSEGLWELAVIEFPGPSDEFKLTYDTPITSDVLGHLDDHEVERKLDLIAKLPPKNGKKSLKKAALEELAKRAKEALLPAPKPATCGI